MHIQVAIALASKFARPLFSASSSLALIENGPTGSSNTAVVVPVSLGLLPLARKRLIRNHIGNGIIAENNQAGRFHLR